ncbi:mitochondrial outer membrane import complex protein METAXIN isoform X1 [Cinnamomum micranthum f. kanehirae]|uniref:Metaxin n=1 Tax=Cinnamomum micranthum f. kanehirae TaxID=337451 RepID=A0A3S3QF34_9MAGN|nr:mitochondrial outer membrane import complex protein METAXIN isoform X1 [Cinnamomum micranthum f. kanehirae]
MEDQKEKGLVLVARKPCFGLPTACPSCLPVYIYLRFASLSFDMHFDTSNPDSDDIPYVEYGDYVAFDNEKGGVIGNLKEYGIVDLDSKLPTHSFPEWLSTKAMVSSWLVDATSYELWVGSDGSAADKIYFSDLPWPIGKVLHWKHTQIVKQRLGITKLNFEERTSEIYTKADKAYEALSMKLAEQNFFFENRPTSLDAIILGHALFVLQALDDTSILRSKLMQYDNLVRYAENLKMEFLLASSSSSVPISRHDPSTSSTPTRRASSFWSSKPKREPKREKTQEEKTFRRRGKYFLAAQAISVLVFLSLLGGSDDAEVDIDDDDDGLNYED